LVFIFLIVRNNSGQSLLIADTVQSLHPHDGALAVLQTVPVRHRDSPHTVQGGGGTHPITSLGPVLRPQTEGRTATSGQNCLLVFPGETVRPRLLGLTLSHRLAQSYKLPAYSDILDISQDVVATSRQNLFDFILELIEIRLEANLAGENLFSK